MFETMDKKLLYRLAQRLVFGRYLVHISTRSSAIVISFHNFPQSQANARIIPHLHHACLHPNLFQFISHPNIRHCAVSILNILLNNLPNRK
jgi:hypothetical protein